MCWLAVRRAIDFWETTAPRRPRSMAEVARRDRRRRVDQRVERRRRQLRRQLRQQRARRVRAPHRPLRPARVGRPALRADGRRRRARAAHRPDGVPLPQGGRSAGRRRRLPPVHRLADPGTGPRRAPRRRRGAVHSPARSRRADRADVGGDRPDHRAGARQLPAGLLPSGDHRRRPRAAGVVK